nr:FecR family protein [uncultured Sediminibacterium sp.]
MPKQEKLERKELERLARKFISGKATEAETAFLDSYYAQFGKEPHVLDGFTQEETQLLESQMQERIIQRIRKQQKAPVRKMWWRYAAAAVFLGAIAGAYFLLKMPEQITAPAFSVYKNDVEPGKVGAIVVLPNGKQVLLDTAANGLLANEDYAGISKNDDNLSIASAGADRPVEYITVIVPVKRTQKINLPDGSTVWLNAGSSMVFPTRFTGNERLIKVTGEIIAKVTHNAAQPFRVEMRGTIYEDKGTEFNISGYEEDAVVKTTVLEGLVAAKGMLIKAGEQAQIGVSGEVKISKDIPLQKLDEIFAWRDEQFSFSGASAEAILKQVAKWYDVELVFQDPIKEEFTISVDRKKPLSSLLKSMERSGEVHFDIDGRRVTVRK